MLQRTEQWFLDRLGNATASKFHDICSNGRYGESAKRKAYKYQLITERLTGNPTESFTSKAMQHGTDNEDSAILAYEFKTGYLTEESGFIPHPEYPDAGASPDRLVGLDGGVEVKCPDTATHVETLVKKEIPSIYREQMLGGMWVTGRKWWDFVSYDPRLPEELQLVIIRLERNEDEIKELESKIVAFLEEVDEELMRIMNLMEEL